MLRADHRLLDPLWLLLAASGGLFAYGLVVQFLEARGIVLPLPVPAFHFHLYLSATLALFFAVGAAEVAHRASKWLPRLGGWFGPALVACVFAAPALLTYPGRRDFTYWRREALRLGGDPTMIALHRFARERATERDIFLCDDDQAMFGIVAAGRHVVAVPDTMSNPYVSHEMRHRDRNAAFAAIRAGDRPRFDAIARAYGITFVVATPTTVDDCCGVGVPPAWLTPVLEEAGLRVFRASPSPRGD